MILLLCVCVCFNCSLVYLTELALSCVVDGGSISHACQVVEGVHTGSEVWIA